MTNTLARISNPVINSALGNFDSYLTNSTAPIEMMIRNLINVAIGIGGAAFFVILLSGGFAYVTAGGDKEAVQKATARIKTAIIGIGILLSVFAIAWVVEALFGIPLLSFTIPMPE